MTLNEKRGKRVGVDVVVVDIDFCKLELNSIYRGSYYPPSQALLAYRLLGIVRGSGLISRQSLSTPSLGSQGIRYKLTYYTTLLQGSRGFGRAELNFVIPSLIRSAHHYSIGMHD